MKKTTFLVITILFIGIIGGCNQNDALTDVKAIMEQSTKDITAFDASGLYYVRLKVSSKNKELLAGYTDKSFQISFKKPKSEESSTVSNENNVVADASISIEMGESILPDDAEGLLVSYKNHNNARTTAATARMVTVSLLSIAPKNYLYVYNKSSSNMSVVFAYNKSSLSTGWVNVGTRTVLPRKDTGYCQIGVKQIRATVTYDANAGSYDWFTWQYNKCP